jgi:hypothetical protein
MVRHGGEWNLARLELRQEAATLSGTISVPALGLKDAAVAGDRDGDAAWIEFRAEERGVVRLDGSLQDNLLRSGTDPVTTKWPFFFAPLSNQTQVLLQEYSGSYAYAPGQELLLLPASEAGLRFFELGRLSGTLLPVSRDSFLAILDQVPQALPQETRFVRDASGTVVQFKLGEGSDEESVRGKRRADSGFRFVPIEFSSGPTELSGFLLLPAKPALRAIVVFIQGTGYSTADRPYEMSIARQFLSRGIGVFLFDKRGCGRSSGDWRMASLHELGSDVAAAVETLRSRVELAGAPIGVYGISEGGWIAPLVATRVPVAFVVNQGGPAVRPLEDELDDLTAGIASLKLEPVEHEVAMALGRQMVELYRSPEALPAYRSALDAARQRPWFAGVQTGIPESEDDWRVQWWRKRAQFDPAPYWKRLRVPALIVVGEKDDTMNLARNLALFEQLARANPHLETRVIPMADHGLRRPVGPGTHLSAPVVDWVVSHIQSSWQQDPESQQARDDK